MDVSPNSNDQAEPGRLASFTTACMYAYVLIYCFESPIRYALYFLHASSMILARDALIDIPVTLLFLTQLLQGKLQHAFKIFVFVVIIQGPLLILNFGPASIVTFLFGMKLIITGVLGLVAGRSLLLPSRRVFYVMTGLLIISIAALLVEKLGGNFPWVGMHDTIGGTDIMLSIDWQVSDPIMRRVGGFFRLSIAAAFGISIAAIVVACEIRQRMFRWAILAASWVGIICTTQKGAIVAFLLVATAMALPIRLRMIALRALVIVGAFLNATLPFFTYGMDMAQGNGSVASGTSFAMRVKITWPVSWGWVMDHGTFPFGAGIGGMGAPLKFLFPTAAAFPDNMFIFMYAYFGAFAVLFYFLFASAAWRSIKISASEAEPALAILAFLLFYGIVVSVIEDQLGALFLGATVGLLLSASVVPRPSQTLRSLGLRSENRQVAIGPGGTA